MTYDCQMFPSDVNYHFPNVKALQHLQRGFVLLRDRCFAEAQEHARQYSRLINYEQIPHVDNRVEANPEISLVIVAYNSGRRLLNCLDSIETSANPPYELIVVDNGGNEEVVADLTKRPLLYLKAGCNVLPSAGRNIGVHFSKAPLVAFVDDDAVVGEGYLAAILDAFNRYDIQALRGRVLQHSQEQRSDESNHYDLGTLPFPAMLDIEGNCAFRTETWRRLEGQDPLLFGNEGKEITYRLLAPCTESVFPTIYWPKAVIYHEYAASPDQVAAKNKRHTLMEAYTSFKHPEWHYYLKCRLFYAQSVSARRTGYDLLELVTNVYPPSSTEDSGAAPFFSICIPTYNSAETIGEAINSALGQTYTHFEIVVVDDGSTDRTAEIVSGIRSDKVRYFSKEHSGAPATRNRCIDEARADFMVWLDADDLILPLTLERYADCLVQNNTIDVLYGDLCMFDAEKQKAGVWNYSDYFQWPDTLLAEMILQDPIPNVCVCVRKSCYEKVGTYREDFPRAHDYEFFARLAPSGRFRHVGRVVGRYRQHQSSLSKNGALLQKAYEAKIAQELLATHDLITLFSYCYREGISQRRSEAHAWRLAALVMLKWGDTDAAVQYVVRSMAAEPLRDTIRLHWLLHELYQQHQQGELSQQAVYQGLSGSEEIDELIKAAVYLLRTGNVALCSEYCERLLKIYPEGLETNLLTALCLTVAGDLYHARIAFRSLIDMQVAEVFADTSRCDPDWTASRTLDWHHEKLREVLGELTPRLAITRFTSLLR